MIPIIILLAIIVTLAAILWPFRTDGYVCIWCGMPFGHNDRPLPEDTARHMGKGMCPACREHAAHDMPVHSHPGRSGDQLSPRERTRNA